MNLDPLKRRHGKRLFTLNVFPDKTRAAVKTPLDLIFGPPKRLRSEERADRRMTGPEIPTWLLALMIEFTIAAIIAVVIVEKMGL